MPGGAGTPGGYDGGSGSNSGGSGGGGEGGAAQRAAAQREEVARAAAAAAAAEQARTDALNAQRAAQQAAEGRVDLGFQEVLRKQKIQQDLDNLEDLDDRSDFTGFNTAPIVDIRDIKGEVTDPGSGSYDKLTEVLDSPDVDEGFKRYVRQVQQPITPTPKSGMGTTLKNIALGVLAPQLLAGTKFGTGLNIYNKYQQAKRYVPKIGDIETALKSKLTNNFIGTGDNRFATQNQNKKRTFNEFTRDGNNVQKVSSGKDAVTESIKKYTGVQNTQKAELFKRRSMVEDVLRKGSYQNRDLTSGQRNNLINYIEQINKFLVPVQQGI